MRRCAPSAQRLSSGAYLKSVPVRAAISESVTLTRQMGKSSAAGLVNAVLRRAAAYDLTAEHYSNEAERLCVEYSVSPQIAGLLQTRCPDPV